MKKSGLTAVLAALVILTAGCGGQASVKEIDAAALADRLVAEGTYDDSLESLDIELAEMYFELEESVTVSLYMSGGSTSEEVAVFAAPDEETAAKQLTHVQAYLDSQKESEQDYRPEEVKRLENAILEQRGKYVILCVSADTAAAKQIIEDVFK